MLPSNMGIDEATTLFETLTVDAIQTSQVKAAIDTEVANIIEENKEKVKSIIYNRFIENGWVDGGER